MRLLKNAPKVRFITFGALFYSFVKLCVVTNVLSG